MTQDIPGWTGKAPSGLEPLTSEGSQAKDEPTYKVSTKGLREADADWRASMSHASVLAHAIDTLDGIKASIPEDKRQMFEDQLYVARTALSRIMVTSAKHVVNHTLWERHLAMSKHMRTDLVLCTSTERAEMRTLPIDSDKHLFGSQHPSIQDAITKRRDAGSKTITVKVPEQLVRQASKPAPAKPSTSTAASKPKPAKKPAKKTSEKPPPKSQPQKPATATKPADSKPASSGNSRKSWTKSKNKSTKNK